MPPILKLLRSSKIRVKIKWQIWKFWRKIVTSLNSSFYAALSYFMTKKWKNLIEDHVKICQIWPSESIYKGKFKVIIPSANFFEYLSFCEWAFIRTWVFCLSSGSKSGLVSQLGLCIQTKNHFKTRFLAEFISIYSLNIWFLWMLFFLFCFVFNIDTSISMFLQIRNS